MKKKLLLTYGLTYNEQYYQMIDESLINGQKKQAESFFKSLPKEEKKKYLIRLNDNGDTEQLNFFINLI